MVFVSSSGAQRPQPFVISILNYVEHRVSIRCAERRIRSLHRRIWKMLQYNWHFEANTNEMNFSSTRYFNGDDYEKDTTWRQQKMQMAWQNQNARFRSKKWFVRKILNPILQIFRLEGKLESNDWWMINENFVVFNVFCWISMLYRISLWKSIEESCQRNALINER